MATTDILSELKGDVEELETILKNVSRSNVRTIIATEISSLKSKIDTCEAKLKEKSQAKPSAEKQTPTLYTTKISTYGFDESNKFVKLYINLKNCDQLKSEQATCDFDESSFKFVAHNHLGKNHQLQIQKLAYKIQPTLSSCKVKSDNVIISLRKEKDGQTWGHLTEAERKTKETKDSKMDEKPAGMQDAGADPSGGIMNMMKKMYDEGDDDMKRMIKKTWYESQQKQAKGETPDMPGGGGGMPDMSSMMGGAGGGAGGMPDFSKMMGGAGGGAGGMPDFSKMMGGAGGGAGGMPDFAKMMGGAGAGGMPDMSAMMGGAAGMPEK